MFSPQFVPCASCGATMRADDSNGHACDPERRVAHQMAVLSHEVEWLEREFNAYLESPDGYFEQWLSSRLVRRDRD